MPPFLEIFGRKAKTPAPLRSALCHDPQPTQESNAAAGRDDGVSVRDFAASPSTNSNLPAPPTPMSTLDRAVRMIDPNVRAMLPFSTTIVSIRPHRPTTLTDRTAIITISAPHTPILATYLLKVSAGARGQDRMMNEHRSFLCAHLALFKSYPGAKNPKPMGWGTYLKHQDVHFLLVEHEEKKREERVAPAEMGERKGKEKEEEGEGNEVEEGYFEGGGSAMLDEEGFPIYEESMYGNASEGEGEASGGGILGGRPEGRNVAACCSDRSRACGAAPWIGAPAVETAMRF